MENDDWIIVTGNPVDGFTFIGPYSDANEAANAASNDHHINGDWWISKIERPGTRG